MGLAQPAAPVTRPTVKNPAERIAASSSVASADCRVLLPQDRILPVRADLAAGGGSWSMN